MFTESPPTSRNFLQITIWKTLLKACSTLIYITTQLECRSKKALMPKSMVSQPLRVDTLNWWRDKCFWNGPQNCRTMEQLISWRNASPMAIEGIPLVSFTIFHLDNTSFLFLHVSFGEFWYKNYASVWGQYGSWVMGVYSRPFNGVWSSTTNVLWWYRPFIWRIVPHLLL